MSTIELNQESLFDLSNDNFSESGTTAFNALQSDSLPLNRSWVDVTDELLDILSLQDDWDGLGASAPSKTLVRHCFDLVRILREKCSAPPPDIVRPTPDGNICFGWQTDSGHLEIEAFPDSTIELIKV